MKTKEKKNDWFLILNKTQMLKAKLFSDNFFSRHNFIIEDTFLKIAKKHSQIRSTHIDNPKV